MGFKKLLQRSLQWAYRCDEPPEERFRKTILIPIIFVSAIPSIPAIPMQTLFSQIHIILYEVVCLVELVYIWWTKTLSMNLTEFIIVHFLISQIFLMDLRTYGLLEGWCLMVIAMDLLLLCSCRSSTVAAAQMLCIGYLIFRTVDQTFNVGWYSEDFPLSTYDIPKEACKMGTTIGMYVLYIRGTTLISDFLMTRYFAYSMQAEQARIKSSVALAKKVADALVDFDLDLAEGALEASDDVGGLHDALGHLLANLRSYRPYLPEALFELDSDASAVDAASPLHPGIPPPEGKVAMAFTDIKSSTLLWEECPTGMRKAMAVHNFIMRESLLRYNGYEVKTIGDAFMVAFSDVRNAVAFCLASQEAMYASDEWPEDLLRHPLCAPDDLWNGLRVRMGVHVGEMDMQLNPVTGRADYFGPNVNIAARLESVARGGTVAVTVDVLDDLEELQDFQLCSLDIGTQRLRGVQESYHVVLLTTEGLKGRLSNDDELSCSSPLTKAHTPHSWSSKSSLGTIHLNHHSSVSPAIVRKAMHKTVGTVTHTRVDYSFLEKDEEFGPLVNQVITASLEAAERTNGVLVSVGSSSIIAGWNIGRKPMYGHASQAALSAGLLRKLLRDAPCKRYITCGIATGGIMHGTVGTESQRFVVAVGRCLEIAGELAVAASTLGASALVGALSNNKCVADDPSLVRFTRRVDTWHTSSGEMLVHELKADANLLGGLSCVEDCWGWSLEYDNAFAQRDVALIRENAEGDPVLHNVASVLDGSLSLMRGGVAESIDVSG